jgi:hypothetical protein
LYYSRTLLFRSFQRSSFTCIFVFNQFTMNDIFTLELPVKPYVKAFLINNCGTPADLSLIPLIYHDYITCLKNPTKRSDNTLVCNYPDYINVIIPKDVFYRYGWEMTKTDIIRLNNKIESQIKFTSRNYIGINNAMGIPVAVSIREYQSLFSFSEDAFPYETIKKDYDRHGHKINKPLIRDLRAEITNIFMASLSDLGTISKKFKNERHQQAITAG